MELESVENLVVSDIKLCSIASGSRSDDISLNTGIKCLAESVVIFLGKILLRFILYII